VDDVLRALEDERLIKRVYLRYCDVIDAKDYDALSEVFTADCVGDYSNTNGIVQEGLAPLVEYLHDVMGRGSCCGPTHHNVLNFRIDPDGDTASGHVHFYAVHQGARELTGKMYTCWGQYDDELVRTPEGWRVSRRMYTNYVEEGDKGIVNSNGGGGS
jgi:ketosteroid isomerase-like protein